MQPKIVRAVVLPIVFACSILLLAGDVDASRHESPVDHQVELHVLQMRSAKVTSNNALATFTDTNLATSGSDYTAEITWNDGTESDGLVTGSQGYFDVCGDHQYTDGVDVHSISVKISIDGYTISQSSDPFSTLPYPVEPIEHEVQSLSSTQSDSAHVISPPQSNGSALPSQSPSIRPGSGKRTPVQTGPSVVKPSLAEPGPNVNNNPAPVRDVSRPKRSAASTDKPQVKNVGLVIFEPMISQDISPQVRKLANGCSIWLQFAVGGNPQFTSTPAMFVPTADGKVRLVRNFSMPSNAAAIASASRLGANYAVTSVLTSNSGKYTLQFQVRAVDKGKHAALKPTSISWTDNDGQWIGWQVVIHIASAILQQVATDSNIALQPTAFEAPSDSELASIQDWADSSNLFVPASLRKRQSEAFAGALRCALECDAQSVEQMPHSAWDYTPTWDAAALVRGSEEPPFTLAVGHYSNSNLQLSLATLWESPQDAAHVTEYVRLAKEVSKKFPNSLDATLALSRAYETLVSTSKLDSAVVKNWRESAERAIDQDPSSVDAQLQLAKAAVYDNSRQTAYGAMRQALKVGRGNRDVYHWAFQMYGENGFPSPNDMLSTANRAAGDAGLPISTLYSLYSELPDDDFNHQARAVMRASLIKQASGFDQEKDDAGYCVAQSILGNIDVDLGHYFNAIQELQNACNSTQWSDVDKSAIYQRMGAAEAMIALDKSQGDQSKMWRQSAASCQRAIRLNPANVRAYETLYEADDALDNIDDEFDVLKSLLNAPDQSALQRPLDYYYRNFVRIYLKYEPDRFEEVVDALDKDCAADGESQLQRSTRIDLLTQLSDYLCQNGSLSVDESTREKFVDLLSRTNANIHNWRIWERLGELQYLMRNSEAEKRTARENCRDRDIMSKDVATRLSSESHGKDAERLADDLIEARAGRDEFIKTRDPNYLTLCNNKYEDAILIDPTNAQAYLFDGYYYEYYRGEKGDNLNPASTAKLQFLTAANNAGGNSDIRDEANNQLKELSNNHQ